MFGVARRLVGGPVALGLFGELLAPLLGAHFHAVDQAVLGVSARIRCGPLGLGLFLLLRAPFFAPGLRTTGDQDQGREGEDEVFHISFR